MEDLINYPFLILFKVTYDYKFKVTGDYKNKTANVKYLSSQQFSVMFFCFDLFPQCTHVQTRSDSIHNVKDFIPTFTTK